MVLVVAYVSCYFVVRGTHILIHRVSFATEARGLTYFHKVIAGDFGPGLTQSAFTQLGVSSSLIAFTPLRWVESFVWNFVPRRYEFPKHAV